MIQKWSTYIPWVSGEDSWSARLFTTWLVNFAHQLFGLSSKYLLQGPIIQLFLFPQYLTAMFNLKSPFLYIEHLSTLWIVFTIWAATWEFQQCGLCDQQRLRPACAYAQSDQSLCYLLEYSMTVMLLTEQHLKFLSLKGGCTGISESILVKIPHCWKSHVSTRIYIWFLIVYCQYRLILWMKKCGAW